MTDRIKNLKDFILQKQHHRYRRSSSEIGLKNLATEFFQQNIPPIQRASILFSSLLKEETPVILPGEQIVFTRTIKDIPEIFTQEEWTNIQQTHYIHERGTVCNISPDYEYTLVHGLEFRKKEIEKKLVDASLTNENIIFLQSAYSCIVAIQELISRYEQKALSIGEKEVAATLHIIKTEGARHFREALQLLRILHFSLWVAGNYHNTFGRFDQYLFPFYQKDIQEGILTRDGAFELLEEFFLSCNKDSDLYPGMQQGDNGQSMVLGGRSITGEYLFNELSQMCLQASYELRLIDPKINIRVDKDTPEDIYEMGSRLTKIGLGFPQYSNDDVIIPGLLRKGYSKEDAYDYVVAACWEFIIPKVAMDIPNIDAVSLIECVNNTIPCLDECPTYESFFKLVETQINKQVERIMEKHKNLYMIPSPMISLLMTGTVERAQDISTGSKYNNYGIHGTGIASAVDSLAVIKKYYYEEHRLTSKNLIQALENNYEGYSELQTLFRNEAPKMGQDDDYADQIAQELLESFDRSMENRVNERGGIYRAGTGTAMYYIFHSKDLPATPDGRSYGEMLPANYSPSLFIKQKGPISVIKSFTKPNLTHLINGGPLTLEFDQSVFNNEESIQKLGMLVRTYVHLGGHQLQLNTVSREALLDAKVHPEKYKNLIVRVWGWSGYFVELDECYQDHVINRIEFGI